jgi:hypothetical protein
MLVPNRAREMYAGIYPQEVVALPIELNFLLASIQNEVSALGDENMTITNEANQLESLLESVGQESSIIRDAMEEQTVARTLLLRFGLPYLPGAEVVWLTLSEYFANANTATEQALVQLSKAIEQIKALVVIQLKTDQEDRLRALELEEKQHQSGIITLQKSEDLLGENNLNVQKDGAIAQKKLRLIAISNEKVKIKRSIQATIATMSNLVKSFINVNHFDKTQLAMA